MCLCADGVTQQREKTAVLEAPPPGGERVGPHPDGRLGRGWVAGCSDRQKVTAQTQVQGGWRWWCESAGVLF